MGVAQGRATVVGWKSPLSGSISVTGTVSVSAMCGLANPVTWFLLDANGGMLQSGTGSGSIGAVTSVSSNGGVYLVVDYAGSSLTYSAPCAADVAFQVQAAGTTPHVTLASPASGSLISGGQPTFSGSASDGFGFSHQVTVRLYKGGAASGTPLETLTATRSGAGYSVGASPPVGDGTYTAQAEQDDLVGDHGFSPPVTFFIHNAAASIKLNSLGSKPLHTSTPTFTGVAGTKSGDSSNVAVLIYPGTNTNGTPVRSSTGQHGGNGSFSIRITPSLADGRYTAVATQQGPTALGLSFPQTFRIKVHAPALTLDKPAAGANVGDSRPVFIGKAGTAIGDSSRVSLVLYSGGAARGRSLGTVAAKRSGPLWYIRWPRRLKLGLYTARAKQSDDAGHTGRTAAHTFLIVPGSPPGPPNTGPNVTLAQSGLLSVPLTCAAPAGTTCTGTVLVLTLRNFRPVSGGPAGRLRVLFTYVSIPAGTTVVIHGEVSGPVARALRRNAPLQVTLNANLTQSGGPTRNTQEVRLLRLG
jgi:hypothetical protein